MAAGLLLPLGLDPFALAAALGMAGLEKRDRLRVTLVFTAFEAGMPIAGMLIGRVAGALLRAPGGFRGGPFPLPCAPSLFCLAPRAGAHKARPSAPSLRHD